jgi:hypothetical protein
MNHLFKSFITLIVFSALLSSCDTEQETIPSYLHVTKFTLTTNTLSEGLNTVDVTSAKVFVNGQEIGNFELPATFPVRVEGDAKIEVFPNVKENGLSNSQKIYKPYNPYSTQAKLRKGQIDTIKPSTTYRASTVLKFDFMEDFEDQGIALESTPNNTTNDSFVVLATSTPGVSQPFTNSSYCGFIKMTTDSFAVFERVTKIITLPNLGNDNYIELDLKSNINFQVGLYEYLNGDVVQVPVMVAYPTNGVWKKLYVNLKPETGDLPAGTPLRIFFGFYKNANDTEDKYVYIDNIKILHLD